MKYNSKVNFKLNEYFLQRHGMVNYRKGWLKGDCPSCGKEMKFGVHIAQNRTNCFICGYNERPMQVLASIEGLQTQNDIMNFLGTFEGIEYIETQVEYFTEKQNVELPESFKLIILGKSIIANKARATLKKRGFNLTELAMRGIGYCTRGDYANRIIIPFYAKGKLVYWNARAILFGDIKFKNPSTDELGIGKSLLMFNVDALAMQRRIYLLESATNALTIGERGVAILGKILSNHQLSQILRSPVKEVIIILDEDAWNYTLQAALKLVMYKKVKVIKMPEEIDVNDMGRKETLKLVKAAPWETHRSLVLKQKELEL